MKVFCVQSFKTSDFKADMTFIVMADDQSDAIDMFKAEYPDDKGFITINRIELKRGITIINNLD